MPPGPVVLLLSPGLAVRAQTPQTQRYLRVLVPSDAEDQAPVPARARPSSSGIWRPPVIPAYQVIFLTAGSWRDDAPGVTMLLA
jgi:hypothetical protein